MLTVCRNGGMSVMHKNTNQTAASGRDGAAVNGSAVGSPRHASGGFGPETMIGSAAIHVLRRSFAAALLGLTLLLSLAAPNEAYAQQGCQVGTAKHRAGLKFDHHRQNSAGKFTVATATYRALIALGETTLPAWTGANISGNAPTTAISVNDLRAVLTSEGLNPNEPLGWRIIVNELACVERGLPAITISGGPEVSEGADAQFTVNVSRASGSAMTVNLNVEDVAGSDFVAPGNQGRQTVSIPANQTSATYPVPIVNDESDEANGYVTVTVVGGGVGDGYTFTPGAQARVWVSDSTAGQVFVSNIRQTSGGSPGNFNFERAQAFTTGSRKSGYTLKSVDILFDENELDDLFRISNPRLTATIRNDSGGSPGTTVVGTLNLPRSSPTFDSFHTMTFRAPAKGIQLSPSTTYFLVITPAESGSPGRDAKLRLVGSDAEDAGGFAGFSIGNQSWYYASWNNTWISAQSWRMSVKGEPNPFTDVVQMSSVKRRLAEFGNHKANGGARFVVEIGDGLSPQGYARTINYTVDGSADRGDGKDYTIDGCTSSTCSVRLPANRHSAVITINVNDDGLDESDETIVLTLQDGSGYTVNKARRTTTVTITDDDTRGLTFHRRWPDVPEGGSQTYTVKLKSQPTEPVEVLITSNNPDVTTTPTSLLFNPTSAVRWDTAQTVTVHAAHDSDAEDDTATLTHTTSGGDYGGANALSIERPVSVDDDDTADPTTPRLPRISLAGGPAVTEGAAASFTVNADPAPTSSLTVSVEVFEPPGQDFVAASEERVRTVTLNAGATSTTFTVPTVDDGTDEDDGYVQAYVNDGTGYVAGQGAAVTVRDNDHPIPAVSFNSASSSAAEDGGTRVVNLFLTPPPAPAGGLTLRYSVAGTATAGSGNDFTIQNSGTVNIPAGDPSASISIAINDDNAIENAETVILTLIGGTGYTVGTTSVHTLTITDNDSMSASFAAAASSAAEDAGTHNVTVNLSSAAPSGGLTLGYSVAGTATAGGGNDFTIQGSGSLSVAAGATSATIPVAINDDSAAESAETVILILTGGTGYTLGSPSVHTLTITDNDGTGQATLSLSGPAGADEGNSGTSDRYFTVSLSKAPSRFVAWQLCFGGSATIDAAGGGTIPAGADYQAISGQTPIDLSGRNPVCTSRTFKTTDSSFTNTGLGIRIKGDTESESDETVIVTLRIDDGPDDVVLGTSVVTYTIRNDDDTSQPTASFAAGASSAAENAGTRNVRVNLFPAAPSGGLTLSYGVTGTATLGSDFTIRNSGRLRVAAEATSAVIPIAIRDDSTEERDETVVLTLSGGTGYTLGSTRTHRLTITDNDDDPEGMATVSVSDAEGYKACGIITFKVSVNRAIDAVTEPNGIGISVRTRESTPVTAVEGTDFHANAETFRFNPGDNLHEQFRVRLIESPNDSGEPKTFEVVLSDVTGAEIGDGVAIGTIVDDFPIAGCGSSLAHAPLVPSSSNPLREGLVRVVNPSAQAGEVQIVAIDDAGWRSAPVTLAIAAGGSAQFTSRDLEQGNAAMGLLGSTGPGTGDWRLEMSSSLDVEVLPYVRTTDGTLSAMGDVAPVADNVHRVALFHPADSPDAASKLRLTNRGAQALRADITGIDDTGASPGGMVSVEIASDESVLLTAAELEAGGSNLLGALGDGEGQWRLDIASDGDLAVMNLAETSDGNLTNLSNATATTVPARKAHVVGRFPSSSDLSNEQGVVRIVNSSESPAVVRIEPNDSTGWRYAPLTLTLGANEAANLGTWDLELGNATKGLSGNAGPGTGGAWRLAISSDSDIEVLTYTRTSSGLLKVPPADTVTEDKLR